MGMQEQTSLATNKEHTRNKQAKIIFRKYLKKRPQQKDI